MQHLKAYNKYTRNPSKIENLMAKHRVHRSYLAKRFK